MELFGTGRATFFPETQFQEMKDDGKLSDIHRKYHLAVALTSVWQGDQHPGSALTMSPEPFSRRLHPDFSL